MLWAALLAIQCGFALEVLVRLLRTARGQTIAASVPADRTPNVTVVVPVLDEELRLGACLDGLVAQGSEVAEILVVDGGSSDRTSAIARAYEDRDARVRFLAAPPAPAGWNGKAWNLETALRRGGTARWLLFVDADVRAQAALTASLLAHAERTGLRAFSVATRQRVARAFDGALHPAMLATLVYRHGIPGTASRRVRDVQANGQCFFAERTVLTATGALHAARGSRCEDVTTARALARAGIAVGFYESDDLVDVAMYAGWRETLAGWPRSLPLSDRFVSARHGLATVWLVQALPPLMLALVLARGGGRVASRVAAVQAGLVLMRIGVLIGMRRAYVRPPWTYWLSPLSDLPVAAAITASALRRRQTWRGRPVAFDERP